MTVNTSVITQLIPTLELIIGHPQQVPILAATEAQNRFYLTFQKFIRALAVPEHPLVLFLDDLQWADVASLKLIQLLLKTPDILNLLLIGAYRDNEISATHPLVITLKDLKNEGVVWEEIFLTPLSLVDINRLIADTLHCPDESSFPLAELVQLKTGGNPFFINEFLKSLYAEGLLEFDRHNKSWQWSIEQIHSRQITDNFVELMASKIEKLSSPTKRVLHLAACIGNQFELNILATVSRQSLKDTAFALREAIAIGLILPLSSAYKSVELDIPLPENIPPIKYKFAHDRIHQATYYLISQANRQVIHNQIGQILLQNTSLKEQEEKIFDIVNHLNLSRELITQWQQQQKLARLNLIAGTKAKNSTAYREALNFFEIALELLDRNCWKNQYELSLALYNLAAETAYLCGEFANMDRLLEVVMHQAKTILSQLKAYEIKIQAYTSQSQFLAAIDLVLQALKLLGVDLPNPPTPLDIQRSFAETSAKLASKKIEDLINLPRNQNAIAQGIMRLLASANAPAYQAAPQLFPLIILKMIDLSLEYGNTEISPLAYGLYAILLGAIFQDIDLSYQFAQLALSLLEKINNKQIECKTKFVVNTSVLFRKVHLKQTIQPLLEAYQIGLDNGEFEFAAYQKC